MRRPRPLYFLARALRNVVAAPLPALVTAGTIGVALFLFGALLLTGTNLRRALLGWAGEGEHLTVYLEVGLPEAQAAVARASIERLAVVERIERIEPREGFEELRALLGRSASVLDGVEPRGVLPEVLEVSVLTENLTSVDLDGLARRIGVIAGVEDVESERLWLERYAGFATLARGLAVGWAVLLAAGALLVIHSSTRLAAYTRKEEIEVLRLVGASDGFVLAPFFFEGALQGAIGALFALVALLGVSLGVDAALRSAGATIPLVGELQFLDLRALGALLAAGPVLGALGSGSSARRFLASLPL